uniref:Uncharacterized protein n=1 Tax=Oryza brachyantha TaxID=4533 RepID=J3MFM0_ORYBR
MTLFISLPSLPPLSLLFFFHFFFGFGLDQDSNRRPQPLLRYHASVHGIIIASLYLFRNTQKLGNKNPGK